MKRYVHLSEVTAEPNRNLAVAGESAEGFSVTFNTGRVSWYPRITFEEDHLEIPDGFTGSEIKAAGAMGIMALLAGRELAVPNDNPSNAEQGILTDDHLRGIAELCHELIRVYRRNQGVIHRAEWEKCTPSQQREVLEKVRYAADGELHKLLTMGFEGELIKAVTRVLL